MNWEQFIKTRIAQLKNRRREEAEYRLLEEKRERLDALIRDLLPETAKQPVLECLEQYISLEEQKSAYLLQKAYYDCIALLKEAGIL